jgi:hypothetical protein
MNLSSQIADWLTAGPLSFTSLKVLCVNNPKDNQALLPTLNAMISSGRIRLSNHKYFLPMKNNQVLKSGSIVQVLHKANGKDRFYLKECEVTINPKTSLVVVKATGKTACGTREAGVEAAALPKIVAVYLSKEDKETGDTAKAINVAAENVALEGGAEPTQPTVPEKPAKVARDPSEPKVKSYKPLNPVAEELLKSIKAKLARKPGKTAPLNTIVEHVGLSEHCHLVNLASRGHIILTGEKKDRVVTLPETQPEIRIRGEAKPKAPKEAPAPKSGTGSDLL